MRVITVAIAMTASLIALAEQSGREVRLTLREGTSMAAALSPDGRTIAIDLLGALWTLGIEGGAATRILEDGYDARMPAWSPDGRRLAFQAYRTSTWNIWTMNADGSDVRQVTSSPFDDREPHWSPDGTRIAFSSDRSGNYDVWVVTLATGALRQVTTSPANDYMPAWSPDGRELAFVSDRREQPGVYTIGPDESGGGALKSAARGNAGPPSWSPDGKDVAFPSIEGHVARLTAGTADITDTNEDVFPFRPQWLSSSDLLYTADGKIKRRPAAGGPARTIELEAQVAFTRAPYTMRKRTFTAQGPQPVRGIMHPVIAPDGSQIVFAALGDLWLMPATGGQATPKRLTDDPFIENDPSWSPDGAMLAFSSDRGGSMDLWVREMPTGRERKVASGAASASWSPVSSRIAFLDPGSQLQVVDIDNGTVRKVHDRLNEPGRPSWSPDGRAVVMSSLKTYSTRFREGTNQVLRVSLEGEADRWFDPVPHKSAGMREDFGPAWSPDGKQMAAVIDGHLAVYDVAPDGSPRAAPRVLSRDLANSPSWTRDSRRVLYQTDDRFKIVTVADGTVREIVPRFSWTPKTTTGRLTVHAGRLFDGRSTTTRDNVDIVIEGSRIARVEPHRAELHTGTVVDASDGTVLPGLIESHTHLSKGFGEALGRIFLSFGVTTIRNPASNPFEAQEDREAIESGVRVGPRVFATGEPFDGTRIYYPGGSALDSDAQVAERLARAETLGFDLVKTYVRLPDLLQKRAIEGAHRIGIPVTSHELYPAVAYGADGVEHIRGTSRRGFSPKMSELRRSYRDVIDLLAASKMTITPTIGIQGGNQYLTLRDASWIDDPRIRRLFPEAVWRGPRALVDRPRSPQDMAAREALLVPQERMVADVVKGGGRVIAGTDSPIIPYGLALLMEMEHYVRGGLSPGEVLRSATAVPAEAMGVAADLGTIESGKLADLIVVDGNPLVTFTDIRRTRRVIKDGVVYEMEALLRGPTRQPASSAAR